MEKGEKGLVLAGFVAAPETVRATTVLAGAAVDKGLVKLKMQELPREAVHEVDVVVAELREIEQEDEAAAVSKVIAVGQ